jgi:hypothetical protein
LPRKSKRFSPSKTRLKKNQTFVPFPSPETAFPDPGKSQLGATGWQRGIFWISREAGCGKPKPERVRVQ